MPFQSSTLRVTDMRDRPALLLSLRPRHAEAIMDGRKTVEVRRRRVSALPGTLVILYASSPLKAVVATGRLESSRMCSADVAWAEFSSTLGLQRHELYAYLGDVDACLLFIDKVRVLNPPIHLGELATSGFRPPQSYRFLGPRDPIQLRSLESLSDHETVQIPGPEGHPARLLPWPMRLLSSRGADPAAG